jgi:hypothetical protein
LIIQRGFKEPLMRMMWKKRFRDYSRNAVLKIVNNAIGRGLTNAIRRVVAMHNVVIVKIQAVCRQFIVRATLLRMRKLARRMGIAVITIQRFWRRSGAFMKAVQEVMAIRRLDTNLYRECKSAHEILLAVQKDASKYYHPQDPRAGLLTAPFLRRLGLAEVIPAFPMKNFKYCVDLRQLSAEAMYVMYEAYQKKVDKNAAEKDSKNSRASRKPNKAIFVDLVNAIRPKLPATTAEAREAIKVGTVRYTLSLVNMTSWNPLLICSPSLQYKK